MEIFSVEPILFYELISHKLKQMLIQKRLRDSLDRQKAGTLMPSRIDFTNNQ